MHRSYSAFPTSRAPAQPRDIDTLRGIQVPGPRSQTGVQTVLTGEATKGSAGTALVMAMLGATLSATVGFVAIGNAKPAQAKTPAVVIAKPVVAAAQAPMTPAVVTPAVIATPVIAAPTTVPVGILSVDAAKGSKVYVDGTLFGATPITVTAPMGSHVVKVELKKGEAKAYDVVFADQPQQLKVEGQHRHGGGYYVRPGTGAGRATTPTTDAAPTEPKDKDLKAEIAKSRQMNQDADAALGVSLGH